MQYIHTAIQSNEKPDFFSSVSQMCVCLVPVCVCVCFKKHSQEMNREQGQHRDIDKTLHYIKSTIGMCVRVCVCM